MCVIINAMEEKHGKSVLSINEIIIKETTVWLEDQTKSVIS